jgi:excinuclease ABC subunit C
MANPYTPNLRPAPEQPGVYLMKDAAGRVVYVGKAKSIKKRLSSYWRAGAELPVKTQRLLAVVGGVEWIVTGTEKEAVILEANLIKRHRPRYNVILRDDKSLPYLRLSVQEDYPRLTVVRRPHLRDGALYFGPFAAPGAMRETLRLLMRAYPLRRCTETEMRRQRPCFYAQTGRCVAPCAEMVSKDEYRSMVDEVVMFLRGKTNDLVSLLRERMERAAEREEFELAALIRDRIRAVEQTVERQAVVSGAEEEADAIGLAREGGLVELALLFIRAGSLIGSRTFSFRRDVDDAELASAFIAQYYPKEHLIPAEILLPVELPEAGLLEEALSEAAGRRIRLLHPQRGDKRRLTEMAQANAESSLRLRLHRGEAIEETQRVLTERLGLTRPPQRIECVDISNIGGEHAVGAIVAFRDGQPDKSGYRRYKVRLEGGPDDYAMMREVLSRRFSKPEEALPDLLLVDGGKGQLNVALRVLQELGLHSRLEVAAIAKERPAGRGKGAEKERVIDRTIDRIFRPGRKNPVGLVAAPLLYLARIRDEAHRFAIGYYQKVHRKSLRSALEEVPGIGPVWRKRLLKEFGSLKRLSEVGLEELLRLPGLGERRARAVHDHLHPAGISSG